MNGTLQGYVDGELIARIEEACAARGLTAGWVRGLGSVSDVHLAREGVGFASYERATLVSLDASVAMLVDRVTVRASAVISVDCGGVPMTVSGELVSARCEGVELALFGFTGIDAQRRVDARGGATLEVSERAVDEGEASVSVSTPAATAPAPAAAPKAAPAAAPKAAPKPAPARASVLRADSEPEGSRSGRRDRPEPHAPSRGTASRQRAAGVTSPSSSSTGADWSKVAAVSAAVASGADWEDEIDVDELLSGDKLLHPVLGVCTVVKVVSDEAIKVQIPGGGVRKLMMRPFRISHDGEGRRFKMAKRT